MKVIDLVNADMSERINRAEVELQTRLAQIDADYEAERAERARGNALHARRRAREHRLLCVGLVLWIAWGVVQLVRAL